MRGARSEAANDTGRKSDRGKVFIAILVLAVGAIIGGICALSLGGGAMAGIGVATGLSAGICSTVQAAVAEGLLTPEQVDQVL